MNAFTLARRGLVHHARAHAATLAGASIGCAVLVGALCVGDSVRYSLERAARLRLGEVDTVVGDGERFFGGERLAGALRSSGLEVAAVLQVPGVASTPDGSRRLDQVDVLGVDGRFVLLKSEDGALRDDGSIWFPGDGDLNSPRLWERLGPGNACYSPEFARRFFRGGDEDGFEFILRVPRPSVGSRDLALVSVEDTVQPLRVTRSGVMGDFSLVGGSGPPTNLYLDREWMASQLGVAGRSNRLFVHAGSDERREALRLALREAWTLDDLGLGWKEVGPARELTSDQVFVSDAVTQALDGYRGPTLAMLTYFVNALEHGERSTPYSTVAALGALGDQPVADLGGWRAQLPDLGADEIALTAWTAEDLGAAAGDTVTLRYFVLGAGRDLVEKTHAFQVRAVLPMSGIATDATLAPEFPGVSEEENCRDWDPGMPMDLDAIRDRDEEYWDQYRAAPKAFVSLETARELWSNRFGSLTALRVPAEDGDAFLGTLRGHLDPGALGLTVTAVSGEVEATSDFGGLFLGLSMFLIVSALLLTALFFAFSVERRASELGVLRVSGFAPRSVGALVLGEAALLLVVAVVAGSVVGAVYTGFLVRALERGWSGALGRTEIVFHAEPRSLVTGALLSFALSLGTAALVLRRALRASPTRLLAGLPLEAPGSARGARRLRAFAIVALSLALTSYVGAKRGGSPVLAFATGAWLLVAGIAAVRVVLARPARARSFVALGWTNAARRPGRSVATVVLMASAVFLLVVAGSNRQGPTPRELPRASGTGGFAFLGRTSLPVLHDLASQEGRDYWGLTDEDLAGVELVAMKASQGDEASCLNLDRPRSPRLLGVDPGRLTGRFRFASAVRSVDDPWQLLAENLGPDVVPAIVDATSLQWTLHAKLGDELPLVDGRGRPFSARVVATLADSILQGDVLVADSRFAEHFPNEVGHRALLVDVPAARADALERRLTKAFADVGLVLVPTHERLDLLHGVQNTYLTIFQALGALGLVLGSFGLLALVLRHGVERRAELALLRASGFRTVHLRLLFLGENGGLVWVGLGIGTLAGAGVVAAQGGALAPLVALAPWILVTGIGGCVWVLLGTIPALSGAPLRALQREGTV